MLTQLLVTLSVWLPPTAGNRKPTATNVTAAPTAPPPIPINLRRWLTFRSRSWFMAGLSRGSGRGQRRSSERQRDGRHRPPRQARQTSLARPDRDVAPLRAFRRGRHGFDVA